MYQVAPLTAEDFLIFARSWDSSMMLESCEQASRVSANIPLIAGLSQGKLSTVEAVKNRIVAMSGDTHADAIY